jgi:diguanylate cyclase
MISADSLRQGTNLLFFNRRKQPEFSAERLLDQLDQSVERNEFLHYAARALFYLIKEFSMDLEEIDSEGFRKHIDAIAEGFGADVPVRQLERSFEDHKGFIQDFISQEKEYLNTRESEFLNIIGMLRNGLSELIGDTQEFNNKVYEQNLRMEQITYLDDIRKIKENLKSEVDLMKRTIQEKQAKDSIKMESLSKEVNVLRSNLEKVKSAALTDGLTGAYNRIALDNHLKRCLERNEIYGIPSAVLLCDIDNFKVVNDTYGHQVGDRVLLTFVSECKVFFGPEAFIARYGGEEFVIVVSGVNLKQALKSARNFCNALALKQYTISDVRSDTHIKFTVSIGVSAVGKKDSNESLVERADKALYQAKNSGKNRAVAEGETKGFFTR